MNRPLSLTLVALALGCISVRPVPQAPAASPVPDSTKAAPVKPTVAAKPAVAQTAVPFTVDSEVVKALVVEGTQHSHVVADLQYLSDVIGPRLTGSSGLRAANEWTEGKFHDYGVDSAWTEGWVFGQGWERGPINLMMLAPHRQQVMGVSWAWAPGTNGPVTGRVEVVDVSSADEFAKQWGGHLSGAWIITRQPVALPNPDVARSTADSLHADSVLRASFQMSDAQRQFRRQLPALLANEGVAGMLVDGAKDFALLTMSGSPKSPLPMPQVVLPHETYAMFYRLRQAGQPVMFRADITNTLTTDTLVAYNTVAEIKGRDHPDEVVLLGAHLDSWDIATGTTDNGTGAIAVLEAARILAQSKVRPSRTIRFALFSGEEEGLLGSAQYAKQHAAELPKYQAVLVLDNGTGRITGVALQGRDELYDAWDSLFTPIKALGPFGIRSANKGGTDHLSFLPYGVPGFNYDQLTRGYNHTHHSQVDTYDHAVPDDIAQAATVMAVNAYELANAPSLLARGQTAAVP